MCEAVRHRGPDDFGSHEVPGLIGLGFRRLSIIDLETGAQPLYSEDRTIAATCNGEIYNFQALRDQLQTAGHRFRTGSDAEVIVHLYEELGLDFVRELRGMFAIALWDEQRRRLVLTRDRLGVKPLYYAERNGGLLYGSEPAGILASDLVSPTPDPVAISHYLSLQYIPPPLTGFEGIRKLAPGELLTHEDGVTQIERYWDLDYSTKTDCSDAEALAELDGLLDEATRLRLVADVPLGAFLSGGIDSSLVVAYMAHHASHVRTFSIDFPVTSHSEAAHARRVSEIYGTEHEEFLLEPHMVPTVAAAVRYAGEPFADVSAIPTYLLSQMTRRHVTVALSGDGGDEAFAGYPRYQLAQAGDRLRALSRVVGPIERGVAKLSGGNGRGGLPRRALRALARTPHDRYAACMVHFAPSEIEGLCRPEFLEAAGGSRRGWDDTLELPGLTGVDRYVALDIATYLPGDLLVKVDRMSMAHALEVRSPLLDHRVHEFAASLPGRMKLRGNTTKWALKELATRRGLPDDLVHRRKQGFGVPVGQWMRDELSDWVRDLVADERSLTRGYFRAEEVTRIFEEHVGGKADHQNRLWNLAMLELWHRAWIDG